MVAKIKSGKSLMGALNYNENKVKAGKAELIATNGYTKSDDALSFHDKLFRLTDLAGRNLRTKTNTVHLSLNFDTSERLDNDRLMGIADDYMKRIGFEFQPYLIYKHTDAGHPHIHIVTTNIQADGKRISLNNIGLLKSEPARKAIEVEYSLVKASDQNREINQPDDLKIKPVEYGKSDTKRSITNIVNDVVRSYRYTSLPELNAILGLYNVFADRGSKDSVMFKNGGLRYWAMDRQGRKMGVPIKASSIYLKPILKLLGDRFKLNEYLRKPLKEQLKNRVDRAIGKVDSLTQLKDELKKADVTLVVRQNVEGRVYGLSYIDHLNKAVFNGSDLGKAYSAAAVVNGFQNKISGGKPIIAEQTFEKVLFMPVGDSVTVGNQTGRTLLDDLLNPGGADQSMPVGLGPKKRKKKRRKLNL
jgi:hypothetical protein